MGRSNIETYIKVASQRYNVSPHLVAAHINVESAWKPDAKVISPVEQSYGLMQIQLKTARNLWKSNKITDSWLLVPWNNIQTGAKLIAENLKRYGGNMMDAIAAYNAGFAKKAGGVYINSVGLPNVQDYVNKVKYSYDKYVSGAKWGRISIPRGIVVVGSGGIIMLLGLASLWYFLTKKKAVR